jgi:glycosyltransferase involved in cell wall biosynthesis
MPTSPRVRLLIVHPRDPAAPTLGGIQTFLGDLIRYAPDDFQISFAGTTRDLKARPVGKWRTIEVHDRRIRFLALAPAADIERPLLTPLRSVVAAARLWRALRVPGRILQVHRPYRRVLIDRSHGPRVQFIHVDLSDWPGPVAWHRLRGAYREFGDPALARMDRVFVVNETGTAELRIERSEIAERIEFLPVWYDPRLFHRVDDAQRAGLRAQLERRLGLPASEAGAPARQFVLTAVRLTEIKRPLLAIAAFAALLNNTRRDAHFVVAGSGELREAAASRAVELSISDRVHFLGDVARPDLARIMQAADALLLSSQSEGGGPRVVLEALACGVPVVATSLIEVRRTVAHGINGWIVDDPTPDALADGLEWALSEPRAAVSPNAAAAAEPFTAERVLAPLFAIYRQLASQAGA